LRRCLGHLDAPADTGGELQKGEQMFDFNNSAQVIAASRRDIDVATGILIALQGHSEREAFAELVAAAHRTGTGITHVARALIGVAGGRDVPVTDRGEALAIWGDSLIGRVAPIWAADRSA
jgi:ANTAR domain